MTTSPLHSPFQSPFNSPWQHTLARPVICESIGLHSGKMVKLALYPAAVGHKITFERGDLGANTVIAADVALVSETRLGTTLTNAQGVSIATVEHLMAALWGAGIDNLRVVVDGPEIPIMDGSSEPFIKMIEAAGLKKQNQKRKVLEVLEPIEVTVGESSLRLLPEDRFVVDIAVEYDHPTISRQAASYDFSRDHFAEVLAEARTFGFAHEVEMMHKMGLARGGSLENAIVLGKDGVLNPEGLRFDDEFVRHKALDLVGDLFLCGYRIQGRVEAFKPGHQINTAMAQALLDKPERWALTTLRDAAAPRASLRKTEAAPLQLALA